MGPRALNDPSVFGFGFWDAERETFSCVVWHRRRTDAIQAGRTQVGVNGEQGMGAGSGKCFESLLEQIKQMCALCAAQSELSLLSPKSLRGLS